MSETGVQAIERLYHPSCFTCCICNVSGTLGAVHMIPRVFNKNNDVIDIILHAGRLGCQQQCMQLMKVGQLSYKYAYAWRALSIVMYACMMHARLHASPNVYYFISYISFIAGRIFCERCETKVHRTKTDWGTMYIHARTCPPTYSYTHTTTHILLLGVFGKLCCLPPADYSRWWVALSEYDSSSNRIVCSQCMHARVTCILSVTLQLQQCMQEPHHPQHVNVGCNNTVTVL